ncbi:MAG: hypothetical protein QXK89_07470 [Candidatus Bathyarchaeia archaeon]
MIKTYGPEKDHGCSEGFKRIMIEAVDEGLNFLGEIVKTTLLLLIKERFHIEKHEIPDKPNEFALALKSILGDDGGKFIGDLIVRCLYSKLGLGIPEGNREFYEYIYEARRKITLTK